VIFVTENSNKFQKNQVFKGRKEKISWECGNTFEGFFTIQFKHEFPFIFGCLKNGYIDYKTMFTCWVSLACNGFHTWAKSTGHTSERLYGMKVFIWSHVLRNVHFTRLYLWTMSSFFLGGNFKKHFSYFNCCGFELTIRGLNPKP
jgi:hypothetical protein